MSQAAEKRLVLVLWELLVLQLDRQVVRRVMVKLARRLLMFEVVEGGQVVMLLDVLIQVSLLLLLVMVLMVMMVV